MESTSKRTRRWAIVIAVMAVAMGGIAISSFPE